MYRANIYAKIGKDYSSAIKEYDLLWKDFIELNENNKDCPTLFNKSGRNCLNKLINTLFYFTLQKFKKNKHGD